MKKRVVFMGTPEFARVILEALINSPVEVVAVVTQPDKPVGRHQERVHSPVKAYALEQRVPVLQPVRVIDALDELKYLAPDLIVTCAYGQWVPKVIRELPSCGSVNVHASLLPKYRGGAPIHWALIRGEHTTGVSLMRMVKAMDAGDVLAQASLTIEPNDDVATLHEKLSRLGAQLLMTHLEALLQNVLTAQAQDDTQATYAPTIQKDDEVIHFNQSVQAVLNRIRGLHPWPVGHVLWGGKRVKVFRAQAGPRGKSHTLGQVVGLMDGGIAVQAEDGCVLLFEVQLEGRKRLSATAFYSGLSAELKASVLHAK